MTALGQALEYLFWSQREPSGNLPEVIVWQYRPHSKNLLSSPTPYRLEEFEDKGYSYGQAWIRRLGEGRFEVFAASGKKAKTDVLRAFRESALANGGVLRVVEK